MLRSKCIQINQASTEQVRLDPVTRYVNSQKATLTPSSGKFKENLIKKQLVLRGINPIRVLFLEKYSGRLYPWLNYNEIEVILLASNKTLNPGTYLPPSWPTSAEML